MLLDKLKDTLEIAGFDIEDIELDILKRTMSMNSYLL